MSVVPATPPVAPPTPVFQSNEAAVAVVPDKVASDRLNQLKRAVQVVSGQRTPQYKKQSTEGIQIDGVLLRVKPTETRSTKRAYHELLVLVGPQNADKLRALPPYKGRFDEATGAFHAVRQTPGEKGVKRTERQKVPANESDWVYDSIVPGTLMTFKDFNMSVAPGNEGSIVTVIDCSSSFWSGDVKDEKTGDEKHIEMLSWLCSGAALVRKMPRSLAISALRRSILPSCFVGDVTSDKFDQQILVLRLPVGEEINRELHKRRCAVALFSPCQDTKDFYDKIGANPNPEMRAVFRGAVAQATDGAAVHRTAFEVSAYKEELGATFLITDPTLWVDVFAWMAHKIPMVLFVKLDPATSHMSNYTSRAIQHRFATEHKPKIEMLEGPVGEAEPEDDDMDGAVDNGGVKGVVKVILFDPYSYKEVLVPATPEYLKRNGSKWKPITSKKETEIKTIDINAVDEVFNVSEKPSYFPALSEHVKEGRGSFGVMTNATTTTPENVTECAKLTTAEGDELLDGKTVRGLTLAYQNGTPKFCLFFFNDVRRKQADSVVGLNLESLASSLEAKTGSIAGIEHAPVVSAAPSKAIAAAPVPPAAAPAPVAAPDDMDDIFGGGGGSVPDLPKEQPSKKSKKDKKGDK